METTQEIKVKEIGGKYYIEAEDAKVIRIQQLKEKTSALLKSYYWELLDKGDFVEKLLEVIEEDFVNGEQAEEIAKFIRLIYLCNGEITLTGNNKGIQERAKVRRDFFCGFLCEKEKELEELVKGIEFIKVEKREGGYTIEQIEEIINKIEQYNKMHYKIRRTEYVGLQADHLDNLIARIEEPTRKKFSFIYDMLVIKGLASNIGVGYSGGIGREKAQFIRNNIKAYYRRIGTIWGVMIDTL